MKLNIKNGSSDLKSSQVTTTTYKIQQNSKMFDILSSKLYTDKILAPIRELLCNAYDAHVAAGTPDKPIDVSLGSSLTIRDYGKGLSVSEMEELYTTYGASNKADSNNFIGCLGLGSKSPFAYTRVFTVVSRHKGMKHQFVCSMSDSVPAIHRFESVRMDSDEKSGLEISFPVESSDKRTFDSKICEFARTFCAPILYSSDGGSPTILERAQLDFGKHGVLLYDKAHSSWGNTRVGVLMGGVLYDYDIPNYSDTVDMCLEQYGAVAHAVSESRQTFVVEAQLGDVDIAASREQCEQRPRTANFVLTKIFNYVDSLENDFLDSLPKDIKIVPRLAAWGHFIDSKDFLSSARLNTELNAFKSIGAICSR